ncbi:MAG: LuxR C-terminal-related transcriptional regulator [Proteobacteria bacterium]|nr:LuxR C-terminal-related transcriptional regulator [Pseudomonadota bacterium]
MEHILGTATINADTQLLNTMSLYRSNQNKPFTEAERALKEVIFPHLIDAVRQNWINNLPYLFPGNQRSNFNTIATCDSLGILQIAVPSFIEICRLEWPKWTGPTLPNCVSHNLQNGELKFVGAKIAVCLSKIGDIFLVRARPKIAADELSERELEVAQMYASGDDYKTIAQVLLVSPSTIRVHLSRIYTKLNINDKTSLTAEIRRMTH